MSDFSNSVLFLSDLLDRIENGLYSGDKKISVSHHDFKKLQLSIDIFSEIQDKNETLKRIPSYHNLFDIHLYDYLYRISYYLFSI